MYTNALLQLVRINRKNKRIVKKWVVFKWSMAYEQKCIYNVWILEIITETKWYILGMLSKFRELFIMRGSDSVRVKVICKIWLVEKFCWSWGSRDHIWRLHEIMQRYLNKYITCWDTDIFHHNEVYKKIIKKYWQEYTESQMRDQMDNKHHRSSNHMCWKIDSEISMSLEKADIKQTSVQIC